MDRLIEHGHVSVLLEESIELLSPRSGESYIDCTVGGGGHSLAILEASSPDGRLLGLDADADALIEAEKRLSNFVGRFSLAQANFRDLTRTARWHDFDAVDGILFDLGVSSFELDRPERGFSFRTEAPLDMRLDQSQGETAADILNGREESELADIFYHYGEERRSRPIARAIVRERAKAPIETTLQLADLVSQVIHERGRIHPATRVFQALRIAVNGELEALEAALPQAFELLGENGRMVVISFHSLEDRIVKRFFAEKARGCLCPPEVPICVCGHKPEVELLTKRAVIPGPSEEEINPRSRSAKLRAIRKLASGEEPTSRKRKRGEPR